MAKRVYVLTKERPSGYVGKIIGVYVNEDDLMTRLEKIARANSLYEMQNVSENTWVIGPTEDEGFFGNEPIYFRKIEAELYE